MTKNVSGWSKEELGYCSNVHPCETFDELIQVIEVYLAGVRQARRLDKMATGLWINASIAQQLTQSDNKLHILKQVLNDNAIELLTLNGFPYGGFHEKTVKENVYQPNWCDERRLRYSIQLAYILSQLLPESENEGTISTVPLGFKQNWSTQDYQQATYNLGKLITELQNIKNSTGVHIRFCIEMEPSCVLEHSDELIDYFHQYLFQQKDVPEVWVKQYFGICYDVCHQAVMYENSLDTLKLLLDQGIPLGKIQISSALAVNDPGSASVLPVLQDYAEPRYLHQVRALDKNNHLLSHVDLVLALDDKKFLTQQQWRIHFHVPVHAEYLQNKKFSTTQQDILSVLDFLKDNRQLHPHIEVETYTWEVLPDGLRPEDDASLIKSINRELTWLEHAMQSRGLLKEYDN